MSNSENFEDSVDIVKSLSPILGAATKLAFALDKGADKLLPKKLADIVKLHSKLGVGSAFIPVPGADLAAGIGIIWSMYVRISKELKLPFTDNILKSVASGMVTNLVGFFAMRAVASALKFLPGIGTIAGTAIAASGQYAITMASGILYMKIITIMLNRHLDMSNMDDVVKEVMSEKESIKDIVSFCKEEAKNREE